MFSENYHLTFDSVDATSIGDQTTTSSLSGSMVFSTFDKKNSNLKLKLDECQITVDSIPYNCGFWKKPEAHLLIILVVKIPW